VSIPQIQVPNAIFIAGNASYSPKIFFVVLKKFLSLLPIFMLLAILTALDLKISKFKDSKIQVACRNTATKSKCSHNAPFSCAVTSIKKTCICSHFNLICIVLYFFCIFALLTHTWFKNQTGAHTPKAKPLSWCVSTFAVQ
jgi:hypothetical protein